MIWTIWFVSFGENLTHFEANTDNPGLHHLLSSLLTTPYRYFRFGPFCSDWHNVQKIVGPKVGVGISVGVGLEVRVGIGVDLGVGVGLGMGVGVGVWVDVGVIVVVGEAGKSQGLGEPFKPVVDLIDTIEISKRRE